MNHIGRGEDRLSQAGQFVFGVVWFCILGVMAFAIACGEQGCGRGSLFLAGLIGGALLIPAYFFTRFFAIFFPTLVTNAPLPRSGEGLGEG